ncbi:unnamed protein product, partial [Mesorhabditis spiculigera]
MRPAGGRCAPDLPCISLLLFLGCFCSTLVLAHSEVRFDLEKALTHDCPGCYNGACVNGSCVCVPGWIGKQCDQCFGRIKITNQSTEIIDGPKSYQSLQKCTWIVENEAATLPTTFRFNSFTTECGWDFLYIYNGKGVYQEQLAALCGKMEKPIELMAPSGNAVLYFVTDMAANYPGFNISFEFDRCPYNCNDHGTCKVDGCHCEDGYSGSSCETAHCVADENPGPCLNKGFCDSGKCNCTSGYHGMYCQQPIALPIWNPVVVTGETTVQRASHASIVDGLGDDNDVIWTVGGYGFSGVKQDMIVTFNLSTRAWTPIQLADEGSHQPENRYDHTVVKYKNQLYMFGGVKEGKEVTSELWVFHMASRTWELVSHGNNTNLEVPPWAVAGHTAHVVKQKMYVIFGYNPLLQQLPHVQVYDFEEKQWTHTEYQTYGRFGHASILVEDVPEPYILIHGGKPLHSNVSDDLIQLKLTGEMKKLSSNPPNRLMLHRAVYFNNLMILTGGNIADDCFNEEMMIYDIACESWVQPDRTSFKQSELARYGHTAVVAGKEKIYVIGGFNGTMRANIIEFHAAKCHSASRPEECQNINGGVRCVYIDSKCQKYDNTRSVKPDFIAVVKNERRANGVYCPESKLKNVPVCGEQKDCVACTSQNGCGWCPTENQCLPSDELCLDTQAILTTWEKCAAAVSAAGSPRPCAMAHNCYSCKLLPHCNWYIDAARPQCITVEEEAFLLNERRAKELDNLTKIGSGFPKTPHFYPLPLPQTPNVTLCTLAGQAACEEATSCSACMDEEQRKGCMWCPSTERCINQEAYTIAFAYGQCQSWVNEASKCGRESATCQDHKTCQECQSQPGCGWIDDGSETGLGDCVQGSDNGPRNSSIEVADGQWFFTACPACQCNGHATCEKPSRSDQKTLQCKACSNNTTGEHCRYCAPGFFGDARNGGTCKLCECNGQAEDCDNETGACYCMTKGVVGEHCDRCDTKYIGNVTAGDIYELAVDFIFTFKLKNDNQDKHVNEIFLFSTPYKRDTDVTFQIHCENGTAQVALNLTSNIFDGHLGFGHTKQMMVHTTCDSKGLRRVYLANDPGYAFGTDANTTFYVKVSNFTTPITIQVSFAQSPPINWVLFFVIFAACFIVLLVVAGLLWMIKLRIEVYRRNQNRINEIEHMASRPFSSVRLELTNPYTNSIATPISIEPCAGYKAGVYTLAVRLPTGGRQTTPNGTSGLAVASALCMLTPSQLGVLTAPDNSDNRNNRKRHFRSFIPFLRNNSETQM